MRPSPSSFASYIAMSGASLRDIADLLGHKKIQHTLIYTHLLPSHTRAVVEQMAAWFLSPHTREGGL